MTITGMTKWVVISKLVAIGLAFGAISYFAGTANAEQTQVGLEAQTEIDSTQPAGSENVSAKTYVVEKGDTLGEIARTFLGDESKWEVIARANRIEDPNKLEVGTRLAIPMETGDPQPRGDDTVRTPSRLSDPAPKSAGPGR